MLKRSQTKKFSFYNFLKKNRKGALEISFGWLFAIIAGAVILFLAIFLSSKIIGSSDEVVSAEVGKEITILLNPLETSFETAQTTSITIPLETRINNICENSTPFGRQSLQLDQKRFNKWTETDIKISSYNKYIFSKNETEGKTFYLFSKPFDFPFKIANLIYLTSSNDIYCFADAPLDIKQDLSNLNQKNIKIENCSSGDIMICFGSQKCDVNVNRAYGYVLKENSELYFTDIGDSNALLYAAIFSDKEVYECQVQRLMLRLKELALIYYDKELITRNKNCDENLGATLMELSTVASGMKNSKELGLIKIYAEDVLEKNNARKCLLW
jgi:hypothetical protein